LSLDYFKVGLHYRQKKKISRNHLLDIENSKLRFHGGSQALVVGNGASKFCVEVKKGRKNPWKELKSISMSGSMPN
jgi:hypothetical protein